MRGCGLGLEEIQQVHLDGCGVGAGSLDEKGAEVRLGLHVSWGRGRSVLGDSVTPLHHLWVNMETWAHFAPREVIKPKKGLLYSKMVTIRAQSPQKLP